MFSQWRIILIAWVLTLNKAKQGSSRADGKRMTCGFCSPSVPDWLTAIGTVLAAVVAFVIAFRADFRRWYNRPRFEIEFGNKEPFSRHSRVTIRNPLDGTLFLGPDGKPLVSDSYWIRIRVRNTGRSVARGCEGKLVRITHTRDKTDRTDFDPVMLHWVGVPHRIEFIGKPIDINKGEYEYLDVVYTPAIYPNQFFIPAEDIEPRGINLTPPREDYYLRIVLYGANVEPLGKTFLLRNTGEKYDSFELVQSPMV